MTTPPSEKPADNSNTDAVAELEQRLRRLEKKVRGLVAGGATGSSGASYSASDSRGSWTSADSQRLGSGATSEAMAAIEAQHQMARANDLPAKPSRVLAGAVGSGDVAGVTIDERVMEEKVAQAIAEQLSSLDIKSLLHAEVEKRLETLDVRALLIDEARNLMDGDRFRTLVAETLKDGTLLDGTTPEQLTHDALKKVFDDDGEDGLLERAMIKALNGRRPEELLSAKVGELFERFSKRVGG